MSDVKFNLKPVSKKPSWKYRNKRKSRKEPGFNLDSSRGLSDQIREFVQKYYFDPARKDEKTELEILSGDIKARMGLSAKVPTICNVLGGKKLQIENNVSLIKVTRYGDEIRTPSTTNLYKYELHSGTLPVSPWNKLKKSTKAGENPLDIIKKRLAKGEITIEEYESLKEIISI